MCRLLGFRFASRIRDLKEKRLYVLPGMTVPPELASLAAGAINLRVISDHWLELLRLALSIKTGTVTASMILRKLAAYPRKWPLPKRKRRSITFPFVPILWGVSYATSTKLSRVPSSSMLFRLTCRPDRSTVVTLFPSDRRAPHVLPDECRGRVPGRKLE